MPPSSGVGTDWRAETFEDNFADVIKGQSFAYAQVGNRVRYENLFWLRVSAESRGQLHCRSEEIVILFYRFACCGADSDLEQALGVRSRVLL
jgi:hypothetical protein